MMDGRCISLILFIQSICFRVVFVDLSIQELGDCCRLQYFGEFLEMTWLIKILGTSLRIRFPSLDIAPFLWVLLLWNRSVSVLFSGCLFSGDFVG